jgi:hypothetical protein
MHAVEVRAIHAGEVRAMHAGEVRAMHAGEVRVIFEADCSKKNGALAKPFASYCLLVLSVS